MVNKIIDYSIENKFLVLITFFLLTLSSLFIIPKTPLDALPDLTPPQIIVSVNYEGQSPKIIEEQVIYELTKSLLATPKIESVRAFTGFESSLVYVIFEEGVDLYWARNRVSELISTIKSNATIKLGVDATGIGWVYEYALRSKTKSLDELREIQDYYLRYALLGLKGVSEVATVGGFERSFEITLKSENLYRYDISLQDILDAIKKNNRDLGGRVIIENGFENMIQAKGFVKNIADIEQILIKSFDNIPLTIKDVANVRMLPLYRAGFADLNGESEVVGGIVVARYKENAYQVIKDVKAKLKELQIDDVEIVETYDRSDLISKAIDNLKKTLIEESLIVIVVILIFLMHIRSAIVILITLPLTILITFLIMYLFGVESNIMSLGGIAIAIGAMVDASIVMIENSHKYLQNNPPNRSEIIIKSSKQVGRAIFFALLLIVVSFLPIFVLEGQEEALFKPLAFTKTFAMLVGAIISITLVPILMIFFIRGNILDEQKNPINRFFIAKYKIILESALQYRYILMFGVLISIFWAYNLYKHQKWEFMPTLNEQIFMYMPVTSAGVGIDVAKEITQKTDEIIKSFPEVKTVFGKSGRADSTTDPAPLSMVETIITFHPKEMWRKGYTYERLLKEMDEKLQILGLTNSWTYPIRGRIDMLLSGIRTPLGIKVYGDSDVELQKIASDIESKLKPLKYTSTIFADRSNSGYYLNLDFIDENLQRYSIDKESVLDYIYYGIGGASVSTLYDNIKQYDITVRFDERESIKDLENIVVKTESGFLPLSKFVKFYYEESSSMLKSENGKKVTYIYISPNTTAKTYKDEATKLLKDIKLPNGYYFEWAGESEYLESAMQKLTFIVPITLIITFIFIYLGLNSLSNALIVFFTIPFAIVGGIFYVDYLDFNFSIAVIVGFLALIGVAVETAIVMIIYLEESMKKLTTFTKESILDAIFEGAVLRVRPKLMTVFAILGSLLPIMYIDGVGSEVMRRIAAPMIGGVLSSTILTLLVIPSIYYIISLIKYKIKIVNN